MTINEIVEGHRNLEIEIPGWLKRYPETEWVEYRERNKKAWLVKEILALVEQNKWKKLIDESKYLAFLWDKLGTENFIVIQKLPSNYSSRYIGSGTYNYKLIIFCEGEEVLSVADFCDEGVYDTLCFPIPIMDLYDVVVSGKPRKPRTAHVCGAQGYNTMLGDSCRGCEEEIAARK